MTKKDLKRVDDAKASAEGLWLQLGDAESFAREAKAKTILLEECRAELRAAREALRSGLFHWEYLKGHSTCIGLNLCHVDLNCVHCYAAGNVSVNRKALREE